MCLTVDSIFDFHYFLKLKCAPIIKQFMYFFLLLFRVACHVDSLNLGQQTVLIRSNLCLKLCKNLRKVFFIPLGLDFYLLIAYLYFLRMLHNIKSLSNKVPIIILKDLLPIVYTIVQHIMLASTSQWKVDGLYEVQ